MKACLLLASLAAIILLLVSGSCTPKTEVLKGNQPEGEGMVGVVPIRANETAAIADRRATSQEAGDDAQLSADQLTGLLNLQTEGVSPTMLFALAVVLFALATVTNVCLMGLITMLMWWSHRREVHRIKCGVNHVKDDS